MNLIKVMLRFVVPALLLIMFSSNHLFAQKELKPETRTYLIDGIEQPLKIYYSFDDFATYLETDSDSIIVVNFWATWCKPCVAELPYFEALQTKYASEKLKLILVSLDFKKQIDRKLIPFLQKNKLKSEQILLLDSNEQEWIDRVDAKWSGAIPITLIFNKYKRLFLEQDFHSLEELEAALNKFKKLKDEK